MHRKFTTHEHSILLCKGQSRKNEITVEYCTTHLMTADYFTKPLQGNIFKIFRDVIMEFSHVDTLLTTDLPIKERVEKGPMYRKN